MRTRATSQLPLGLTAVRRAGRTFLSARGVPVVDGVTIDVLRLAFLGDAGAAGATAALERSHLAELRCTLTEGAINRTLAEAIAAANTTDSEQHVREAHVSLLPGRVLLTLVLADEHNDDVLITATGVPTSSRDPYARDTVALLTLEARTYSLSASPPQVLVRDALRALFTTAAFSPHRADDPSQQLSYGWLLDRDLLEVRGAKFILAELLPSAGWKIPIVTPNARTQLVISERRLQLICQDPTFTPHESEDDQEPNDGANAMLCRPDPATAKRLLAQQQARRILRDADNTLYAGRIKAGIESLRELSERIGHHSVIVGRLGLALLAHHGAAAAPQVVTLTPPSTNAHPDSMDTVLLRALCNVASGSQAEILGALRALLATASPERDPNVRYCALLRVAEWETESNRAIVALREAVELVPRGHTALRRLAKLYRARGSHARRVEVLRQLITLVDDPQERRIIYTSLAITLHEELGAVETARRALRQAAMLAEEDPIAMTAVASTYARLGDPAAALNLCNNAAEQAEERGDIELAGEFLFRAATLWRAPLGDPSSAKLACHNALALLPTHGPSMQLLASIHLEEEEPEAALASLEPFLERAERRFRDATDEKDHTEEKDALIDAYKVMAQAYDLLGERDEALYARRRIFSLQPDDSAVFNALVEHFETEAHVEELIELYRHKIRVTTDENVVRELALALARLYDDPLDLPSDALRWFDKAAEIGSLDLLTNTRRADLLEQTGRLFELRDALTLMAEQTLDATHRGTLHARVGRLSLEHLDDPRAALVPLRHAVGLCPKERSHLLDLRRALRALGELEELVDVLERLALLTANPMSRRSLLVEAGDVLFKELNKPQLAFRFYQDALTLGPDPIIQRQVEKILSAARLHGEVQAKHRNTAPDHLGYNGDPPTDLGTLVNTHQAETQTPMPAAWPAPSAASKRPQYENENILDPVSEEFEVTLTAVSAGRVGLQVVPPDDEAFDETHLPTAHVEALNYVSRKPSGKVSFCDEFPQRGASEGGRKHVHTKNVAVSPLGSSSENNLITKQKPLCFADTPPLGAQHLGPAKSHSKTRVAPHLATKPASSISGDHVPTVPQSEHFTLPDPRDAPDWREAAQQWSEHSTKAVNEPSASSSFTAHDPTLLAPRDALEKRDIISASERLQAARQDGDSETIIDALEDLLEVEKDPLKQARIRQEAGCRAYFDLEVFFFARTHLEAASMLDPEGVALEGETLTALEGVYEDQQDYEHLLEIYERRLRRAGSSEMTLVYRMLMAHLCAERLLQPEETLRLLEEALAISPKHVPALQLLQAVEHELGDLVSAYKHACTIPPLLTKHSPAWAEAEVTSGELALALGLFEDGKSALRRALTASEHPMHVLDRLKEACRTCDDWKGLLDTLVAECALIIGEDYETFAISDALSLSLSSLQDMRRRRATRTVREIADVLSLKLDDTLPAWRAYGAVCKALPDDVYALERRIELGRTLKKSKPLAVDLETLAGMLMDPRARFQALVEAGILFHEEVRDGLRARDVFARALGIFAGRNAHKPDDYKTIKARVERLDHVEIVHVSLGNNAGRPSTSPRIRLPQALGSNAKNGEESPNENVAFYVTPIDKEAAPDTGADATPDKETEKHHVTLPQARVPQAPDESHLEIRLAAQPMRSEDKHIPSSLLSTQVTTSDTPAEMTPNDKPALREDADIRVGDTDENVVTTGHGDNDKGADEPNNGESNENQNANDTSVSDAPDDDSHSTQSDDDADADQHDNDESRTNRSDDEHNVDGGDNGEHNADPDQSAIDNIGSNDDERGAEDSPPDASDAEHIPSHPMRSPKLPHSTLDIIATSNRAISSTDDNPAIDLADLMASTRGINNAPEVNQSPPDQSANTQRPTPQAGSASPTPAALMAASPTPAMPLGALSPQGTPAPHYDTLSEPPPLAQRITALEEALDNAPGRDRRVELLTEKGLLLAHEPETQGDARGALRSALALNPLYVPARLALVNGLLASGELEQAINHLVVLKQRLSPSALSDDHHEEACSLLDAIAGSGIKGVVARANALREAFKQRDS